MTDAQIATALRQIHQGTALSAVVEYELEDLGLITTDDGPYAKLTTDGLLNATMTREDAFKILADREGFPPESAECSTTEHLIAAALAPAGQPCADCGALVVYSDDHEWQHVEPSTCFLASHEIPRGS